MVKNKTNQIFPLIALAAILVIVGAVALIFYQGNLSGALTYRNLLDEPQFFCLEEDEANKYFVRGKVTMGNYEYYDHCRNGKLYQYYCVSSNKVRPTRPYTCPYGCLEGVCLPDE